MNSKTHKILLGTFLILVAVLIYGLNYFTPLASDDWAYVFIFGSEDERIHNLGDILQSQYYHYFNWNGRAVVHFLVQSVDSFLGKSGFNILNTVMFLVFLYAIAINVTHEKKNYYKILSLSFILVFLLLPGFSLGMLWLSGSFNYLWTATALLFFHYLLEKKQFSSKAFVPLFLYSFLCGWTNEAFVVGLAGAYFIYFAAHLKSLTTQRCVMLAGFFLGSLFLVFAPASVHRALDSGPGFGLNVMFQALIAMSWLRMTFILIIFIPLLALCKQLDIREWFKREQLIILAWVLSFLFIWFTRHSTAHSCIGIELFALLLILRAIPWAKLSWKLVTVANVITLIVGIMALDVAHKCYIENENEFAQIRRHEYPIKTRMADYHPYFDRFVVGYETYGFGGHYKFYGTSSGMNAYYENDSIYFLPQDFVKSASDSPERFTTVQTQDQWPFYAIRSAANDSTATDAVLELEPIDYNKFIWPLNRLVSKVPAYTNYDIQVKTEQVVINGQAYILITKIPVLADRVKSVTLKKAT